MQRKQEMSGGFTLLELIAAMIILTIAMSISFEAFSGTIRAWQRGTEVLESVQHGDHSMGQLASALNSTLFFNTQRGLYNFTLEKDQVDGLPADRISFITDGSAFISEDSPLRDVPHRLDLFIDFDEEGEPALFSQTYPAVTQPEEAAEEYQPEPYLVSRAVRGMEFFIYDKQNEDWSEEDWERNNKIPERIMITLYVVSSNPDEEPVAFTRLIDIPVAKSSLKSPTTKGGR